MPSIHSLRWKLMVSYLLLVAAILVAVVLLTRFTVRTVFESYLQTGMERQATTLATLLGAQYARTHDWQTVGAEFNDWSRFTRADVWILDSHGTPVLQQVTSPSPGHPPTTTQIKSALQGNVAEGATPGFYFGSPQRVWVAMPIRAASNVVGVAYLTSVSDPQSPHRGFEFLPSAIVRSADDFVSDVEQRVALTGVVVGVCAILLATALARSITDPVQALKRAVERIAAGDFAQRVTVHTRDEVGSLADAVNGMAANLEAHITELRRQERLRRDLVANVSHDLATPLTGIQGFTEALLDNVVVSEEGRVDLYQSIYREVQRLRRLVGDLQDLSALESGMGHIAPQPLQLPEVVEEALKVEAAEAQERQITLHQDIPDDLPPVMADGDRIAQVLFNLLDNAMRYTPPGGTITTSARRIDREVEVTVTDSGQGIPAEELPQIFERFYRVDRSRSQETGGGGLGLAIVKAIVTAHGGQVGVSSVVGEGTEMRFTLPAVLPVAPPARERKQAPALAR